MTLRNCLDLYSNSWTVTQAIDVRLAVSRQPLRTCGALTAARWFQWFEVGRMSEAPVVLPLGQDVADLTRFSFSSPPALVSALG